MLSFEEHQSAKQRMNAVPEYHKIHISSTRKSPSPEKYEACFNMVKAVQLREKYVMQKRKPGHFKEQLAFNAAVNASPLDFVEPPLPLAPNAEVRVCVMSACSWNRHTTPS